MKKLDINSIHEMNCQSKPSTYNSRLITKVLILLYITLSLCMLLSNIAIWGLVIKEYIGSSRLVYLMLLQDVILVVPPLLIILLIAHTDEKYNKPIAAPIMYIVACSVLNASATGYVSLLKLTSENSFSITGIVNMTALAWLLISAVYAYYELSRCASVK